MKNYKKKNLKYVTVAEMWTYISSQWNELTERLMLEPEVISHEVILLSADPEFDDLAREMLCDFLDLVIREPRASYYRRLKDKSGN